MENKLDDLMKTLAECCDELHAPAITEADIQRIITDAKAVSQSESSFAQEALNKVLSNAIGRTDYLSLETDGITGATLTSQGVIDALTIAIAAAKGERSEEETKGC